jgi:GntR family transcriptional regulator
MRLGYLVADDRLPRVKDVVASLAINPNTVLKAYRDLEQKGLVAGRPGQGTFVVGELDAVRPADHQALVRKLTRWLSEAVAAGLSEEVITDLFTATLHGLRRGVIAS